MKMAIPEMIHKRGAIMTPGKNQVQRIPDNFNRSMIFHKLPNQFKKVEEQPNFFQVIVSV